MFKMCLSVFSDFWFLRVYHASYYLLEIILPMSVTLLNIEQFSLQLIELLLQLLQLFVPVILLSPHIL